MECIVEFHEKIQELRKSRRLTQAKLAELLYVSRTAISNMEAAVAVQQAMNGYHPDIIGYCWDDSNPRIQLEPRGI